MEADVVAIQTSETPERSARQPDLLSAEIEGKTFSGRDRAQHVLDRIAFTVAAGAFVSIVGPSGCGKTTLLRCVAGLDTDYRGSIRISGRPIHGPGLDRGVVFQEPRLLPWMTVEQNVAFACEGRADQTRVRELLALVSLEKARRRWPKQLSGGMSQRVALARAMVNLPELLLLDEPFGALDNFTRARMQAELYRIVQQKGVTALLVTHDIDEALILSDQILVMAANPGRIARMVPVDLVRPRNRNDTGFITLRGEIEAVLSAS
jgi:sulfonate transport system ATP-binding protein